MTHSAGTLWGALGARPVVRTAVSSEAAGHTVLARPGYGGLAGATVLFCLALTPSLLPRSWPVLALASGIAAAIGYGVGAGIGWAGRRLVPERGPRARLVAWWALGLVASTMIGTFMALSVRWQENLRALLGMGVLDTAHTGMILIGAAVVTTAIVLIARIVRGTARAVRGFLARFLPRAVAAVLAVAIVAFMVVGFVRGFLFRGFVSLTSDSASVANTGTTEGTVRPVSPLLSGGPGSLAPWETLGVMGRDFTGRAPTGTQIAEFTGGPARDPIRAYVGLDTASSLAGRVDVALRELDRTGAWDRSVLAVFTTTGTGWVDPRVADSLEYLHAGDTAEVALQYSFLPSWLNYVVDREAAPAAGRALFDAVQHRWAQLRPDDRPRLLVFGESLGSYGAESAFTGLADLTARTDGALFVGPVQVNPVWREVTRGRDPGSPAWLPVYGDGRSVRFADVPSDLAMPPEPWGRSRVVYLQNSSDPVVWWSPSLLFEQPDWLAGVRGPDVPPDMHWYPIVTFWQLVMDLVFAGDVPAGHGHLYGADVVDGWVAVSSPPGWTATDTERLRRLVAAG